MKPGTVAVPDRRVRPVNAAPVRPERAWVVYWMVAARRRRSNFGLQRAVELSRELSRPLLVLEPLRIDYPWASERLHLFLLQGMRSNREAFRSSGVLHHPWVERSPGEGKGLLRALGASACVVVSDEMPGFFLPRMQAAASEQLDCRLELVDGSCLLPLHTTERTFTTAASFRRFLHKELRPHLLERPLPDPLAGVELPPPASLPAKVVRRWPAAGSDLLDDPRSRLGELPVDHEVGPVALEGGEAAALARLEAFLAGSLERYPEDRNHPDDEGSSGLSPYLHFGHVGVHEVFRRLVEREAWSPDRLARKPTGKREGWWGMSAPAEAFLDELVTWRELGYLRATHREDFARYESLPSWARQTLDEHRHDPREPLYSLAELTAARTHDPVWNAAQRQLLREGRIHNYLRMLWGKKILEWSPSPEEAALRMVQLNDRWALDGRDPNSYSGIFWVLGRYDRAWGPERPVFGKIRYMSSENTRRKLRMRRYLERFGPGT